MYYSGPLEDTQTPLIRRRVGSIIAEIVLIFLAIVMISFWIIVITTFTVKLAERPVPPARPPWIDYYLGPIQNISCSAGSTDYMGFVQAMIIQAGTFMIHVHPGQDFPVIPQVVTVSPTLDFPGTDLWANNVSLAGFNVGGVFTGSTNSKNVILFYYQVV